MFHITSTIASFAPGIVAAPLLGLIGFTGGGIAAGSIAAGVQSAMGAVTAGGAFATIQSAAMGGYGAARVAQIANGAIITSNAAWHGTSR